MCPQRGAAWRQDLRSLPGVAPVSQGAEQASTLLRMAMPPCAAGPAAQGNACQAQCTRRSVCASMEAPVVAAPVPGHAWSSPFLCSLSGPDTEPMAAGREATAAGGAPVGGWRTDLAHLWGGANPAQPGPPLHSAPLHARPRSAPDGAAERARRPLGGSPDRASPRGAAARKRQRIGGWAAGPGAAETPATLAARCRRVGRRDMACEGGGCGGTGAAVETTGAGAAEVLAALQRPRGRGCCESGGATSEPAELARPDEAGSMGACTLGASPARVRACREGSKSERTTPAAVAAAVAAAEAEVAAAVAAAEAAAEAAGAAAESEAEAAEHPLLALPPKKRARLEGSACGAAVAADTGAAAGVACTAARPKRLPGGNPLNVRRGLSLRAVLCRNRAAGFGAHIFPSQAQQECFQLSEGVLAFVLLEYGLGAFSLPWHGP